jgi:RHS repeat-associated protein
MNLPKLADPWHFYAHRYDQLNRLTNTDVFKATASGNSLGILTAVNDYHEDFQYDANGNIQKVSRNGTGGTLMDKFDYIYDKDANNNIVNNRLRSVSDIALDAAFSNDLDNQAANNYTYDAIGNLKTDVKAGITGINWSVYGKISTIAGAAPITYTYDAAANRVSKSSVANKYTWYVRDAHGNTIAVYDNIPRSGEAAGINWREQHLYGSSRLGVWNPNVNNVSGITAPTAFQTVGSTWDSKGNRQYELSNHLGNVMAAITDRRLQHSSDNTTIDYFLADAVSEQEYYVFGAQMPGRTINTVGYRYGFNGKENDNDVGKGSGNQQDYGMRIYDPRIGKFLSMDPIASNYPELTPYQFSSNRPIDGIDLDGMERMDFKDHLNIYGVPMGIGSYVVDWYTSGLQDMKDGYVDYAKNEVQNRTDVGYNQSVPENVRAIYYSQNKTAANVKTAEGILDFTSKNQNLMLAVMDANLGPIKVSGAPTYVVKVQRPKGSVFEGLIFKANEANRGNAQLSRLLRWGIVKNRNYSIIASITRAFTEDISSVTVKELKGFGYTKEEFTTWKKTYEEIIELYNKRGGAQKDIQVQKYRLESVNKVLENWKD